MLFVPVGGGGLISGIAAGKASLSGLPCVLWHLLWQAVQLHHAQFLFSVFINALCALLHASSSLFCYDDAAMLATVVICSFEGCFAIHSHRGVPTSCKRCHAALCRARPSGRNAVERDAVGWYCRSQPSQLCTSCWYLSSMLFACRFQYQPCMHSYAAGMGQALSQSCTFLAIFYVKVVSRRTQSH